MTTDPATTTVYFTAVFSEPVSGFGIADVTLGGTAGASAATVTEMAPNDGTTYGVAVTGMTGYGTVTTSIAAGVAEDGAGNPNSASTSSDNSVTLREFHRVTPSAAAGGIISPDRPQSVAQNDQSVFAITPTYGYRVVIPVGGTCGGSYTGDPTDVTAGITYTTDPVAADCTVAANFAVVGSCRTDPLVLMHNYGSGETDYLRSEDSITSNGIVVVGAGAEVTLHAPSIRLVEGVRAALDSHLHAVAMTVSCGGVARMGIPQPHSSAREGEKTPVGTDDLFSSSHLIERRALPTALWQRLSEAGDNTVLFLADANSRWIVFSTGTPLLEGDENGLDDVYLFNVETEELAYISVNANGSTANGASGESAIDGLGRYVAYSSEASDLIAEDRNGVADVYLYRIDWGTTERISLGRQREESAQPAHNPAIGGAVPEILYDRTDDRFGSRRIFGYDAERESTEYLSNQDRGLENHHPAISGDGRFIAYLETPFLSATKTGCSIRYYDRQTALYGHQPCPTLLLEGMEQADPQFSADGAEIIWVGQDGRMVRVVNPLW